MLAKRLFQKAIGGHHQHHLIQHNAGSCLTSEDVDFRVILHYGVPSTASILSFDPLQRLLAIGTLDGRIKVIGGDNIEGLLISSEQQPFKFLQFLQNQGFLISVRNDDTIQVWNLQSRSIGCSLQWESNVTAFSIISGSNYMYIGDEQGEMSVVKYDAEKGELLHLPYHIPASSLSEAAGFSSPIHQPIVGVLPQPCSTWNRVLVAYQSGLIVLWDVVEAHVVIVRGDKVLQLKNDNDSLGDADSSLLGDASKHHLEEKEITALCWASRDGSILAVGYVDGDILFWKTSTATPSEGQQAGLSNNVVKLQLSSGEKRLPVIVLHWWPNDKSHKDGDGQLLIYGGDEMGSDEVLTILNLEWSSGMETMRCFGRMDLTLSGSFADVVLTTETTGNDKAPALFLLTNPGQLQIFDCACFPASISQPEKRLSVSAVDFPVAIPTINPLITVSNLFCLPTNEDSLKVASEIAALKKFSSSPVLSGGTKWPLTGGVSNHLSSDKENRIRKVYVAGYQDGSVQMWDATYPVLSSLCILESQITGVDLAVSVASVSKLGVCFCTLRLAVGDECGLVRLYDLSCSEETSFHFITDNKHEVHQLARIQGPRCLAAFSLLSSRVQALEFTNSGAKLTAGYECGRIAVLDMNSLSALFLTETISSPSSIMTSIICKVPIDGHLENPNYSGPEVSDGQTKNLMFVLRKDGVVCVIDVGTGSMISSCPMRLKKDSAVVSMYVIESRTKASSGLIGRQKQEPAKDVMVNSESSQDMTATENHKYETENNLAESNPSQEHLEELLVLLCCKDALRVYSAKSVAQGDHKSICKIKLAKPSCWTTTFMKDEKACGLVLLYQTGDMEIRSLPDLKLLKQSSLMSVLRWNFRANMDTTMSSTDRGHITLVNGSELAFISVLVSENDFRLPESLPSLHDEVLAAAVKAAISFSSAHKKKQGNGPRILSGIIKGFKREKLNHSMNPAYTSENYYSHLEDVFMRNPFINPSIQTDHYEEAAELSIDDIEIDEVTSSPSTSCLEAQNDKRESKSDREKLFNGESADVKPRLRTREEIIATYRKAGDASSVAGQARNKLLERQEKLERISRQTEELQNGAEDFASLANELVKVMESRKWWHI